MDVKAKARFVRISPRKARLVVDLVRGNDVSEAVHQLAFNTKKASPIVLKLINSAIANAEHNFSLQRNNLYIKEITVNDGPTFKRWQPRAFGRATPIRKRTSHIELLLSEKVPSADPKIKIKGEATKATEVESADVKKTPKAEKVSSGADEVSTGSDTAEGQEIVDVRGQGKHRHMQHQGGHGSRDKGFLKKMFRRKSGQ
ncbi:50S ribosomal protein L22 [Candidatus Falkowbacteria bacterium CG10_big_fil_rev_8_21_14_0_10_39_11]|uniref:Large ribosomal subunit protein uL22 n=1 Tax=Candidatus Falkowbacteria bacterium CG10_big_fil_rev_8_21_14_0_10_39_11 TaxID=1974565 RepID=A0A2H0V3P9_9BACT|nr:MAG: 50S ribosomal protein L22 [Candidatus Falkowbacteria bacterium CG10_big_fil_rev_8_21_14_0_10_39_11]